MKTACLMTWLMLGAIVQGQDFTYTTNNGAITITGYIGSSRNIVIPDFLNGLPVTAIENNAFVQRIDLSSVTMGTNVNFIGGWSFFYCYSLTNVMVGRGVTNIGDRAFDACYGLTSITIPGNVGRIGDGAFALCDSLTNVTLGDGVRSLGSHAFDSCYQLGRVSLPNSVTTLGDEVFANCYILTNCTIPGSITNIGCGAFANCTSLTAFSVAPSNPAFTAVDGVLFNQSQTCIVQYPPGKTETDGVYVIGPSVTNILPYAFAQAGYLTGITIGTNVTCIGSNAFYCGHLISVTVPNSVTSIGNAAFMQITFLSGVTLSANLKNIGDFVFAFDYALTNVTIPNHVGAIGDNTFFYCTNMTNVTIGSGLTNIGIYAFANCDSLESLAVNPLNLHYSSLAGVLYDQNQSRLVQYPPARTGNYAIPKTVTRIETNAFYWCSLTGVSIPDSVTNIGDEAFAECYDLTNLTIPDSVTSIGDYAFADCTALAAVKLSASVTNIGPFTFAYCSSLMHFTVPDTVVTIGRWAFGNCANMTNIVIGNGVSSIGDSAFWNCVFLKNIVFKGNAPTHGIYLFNNDFDATLYYLPGASGWSDWYDSQPCLRWNPVAHPGDPISDMRSNRFGFNITGTANIPIVIEACANLPGGTWMPLQSCTLTNGSIYFNDAQWTNYSSRYYRFRTP